jgi:hypothetical protein
MSSSTLAQRARLTHGELAARHGWAPSPTTVTTTVVAAVLAGLTVALLIAPIAGRGDYGQWLMTARYYMGESVPGYRVIPALPPLVPMVMAAMHTILPDPIATLQATNALILIALGLSFYLLGHRLFASPVTGAFAVVSGLLVTDRYIELFAFGGLLQAAAVIWMCMSVVAFASSRRDGRIGMRWWVAGCVFVGLAVLSHLGTAMVAIPVAIATGATVLWTSRRAGWVHLRVPVYSFGMMLVLLAVYWLAVLGPNSRDYLTNPASLAYRGPDRLFVALGSYPPTVAMAAAGVVAIGIGIIQAIRTRSLNGEVLLGLWLAVAWGALLYTAVSGAATDYPRFATVLLAPLVVACARGIVQLIVLGGGMWRRGWAQSSEALAATCLVGLTLIAAPLMVQRYERQTTVYQPLDATALSQAASFIDGRLADPAATVLTNVREGKWIEGVTGRATLFSQPVRYAFRPIEWQRSVDADALLRSADGMTNGLWLAAFTDRRVGATESAVTSLSLGMNHGGELVRVFDVDEPTVAAVTTTAPPVDELLARSSTSSADAAQTSITTRYAGTGRLKGLEIARTIRVWADSSTIDIVEASSAPLVQAELHTIGRMELTSTQLSGREAIVCLTPVGGSQPCLRIWVAEGDGSVAVTANGAIRLSSRSGRLEAHLTNLRPGVASVGMELLRPAAIAERYQIGAALLYAPDPAYASRSTRLRAIGFTYARAFGPYRVFLRQAPGAVTSP